MTGQTGLYNAETQQFDNITYLKCSPENDFFPDLESSAQVGRCSLLERVSCCGERTYVRNGGGNALRKRRGVCSRRLDLRPCSLPISSSTHATTVAYVWLFAAAAE
jgi:hypothetical protein